MTRNDLEDSSIADHLDLILKWLSCAICSREHTAGLQAILTLLLKLFEFLINRECQMTDFEGSLLLPYLLEKASTSKVSSIETFFSNILFTLSLMLITIYFFFPSGTFWGAFSGIIRKNYNIYQNTPISATKVWTINLCSTYREITHPKNANPSHARMSNMR